MNLDARHRAMLHEMGVRVWWPVDPSPPATAAASAAPAAPTRPDLPTDQTARPSAADPRATGWQVGAAQAVYGSDEVGPRWLLLTEQSEGSGGPVQALLQAMLRAAGLQKGAAVWLAPLHRQATPAAVLGLEEALRSTEPDLVFIMGRLAAQALLESSEPLGQLRGQVHEVWGLPAVVSYDCAALLRHPPDKAKAWDDLCLAAQVARQQYAERKESQGD